MWKVSRWCLRSLVALPDKYSTESIPEENPSESLWVSYLYFYFSLSSIDIVVYVRIGADVRMRDV